MIPREVPSLSIVIPVYNSESSLEELCHRIDGALSAMSSRFEVVFVDDGSRDGSWSAITRLRSRYSWIHPIQLMRNYGQHNAILCGVRAARNQVIVTMDDDLQNPPEEIAKLLARLDDGIDVVYGYPEKETHGLARDLASRITKLALQGAMGSGIAGRVSAFRAFRAELRKGFHDYRSPFVSIDVLLTWATHRFAAIPVQQNHRKHGKSNYSFRKLLAHAVNMMTGFTSLPLQAASLVGFSFTVFGFCILGYTLVKFIALGSVVPGFPFLASIIAIFSGAQLFALGVIGEYLARVHFRTMEMPTYMVREVEKE